jgi:hypothetical protein
LIKEKDNPELPRLNHSIYVTGEPLVFERGVFLFSELVRLNEDARKSGIVLHGEERFPGPHKKAVKKIGLARR